MGPWIWSGTVAGQAQRRLHLPAPPSGGSRSQTSLILYQSVRINGVHLGQSCLPNWGWFILTPPHSASAPLIQSNTYSSVSMAPQPLTAMLLLSTPKRQVCLCYKNWTIGFLCRNFQGDEVFCLSLVTDSSCSYVQCCFVVDVVVAVEKCNLIYV